MTYNPNLDAHLDALTAEVTAGRDPDEARRFVTLSILEAGIQAPPPAPSPLLSDFQAPPREALIVQLLAEDGYSNSEAADAILKGRLPADLDARIEARVSRLEQQHVATRQAEQGATPDARRAAAQAIIDRQQQLQRDSLLADTLLLDSGEFTADMLEALSPQERIDLAFNPVDPDGNMNDLAANLAAARATQVPTLRDMLAPEPQAGEPS